MRNSVECCSADATDLPGPYTACYVVAGEHDGNHHRRESDGRGGTRKREFEWCRATASERADRINEGGCAARTKNGRPDEGLRRGDVKPCNANDHGKRSAHIDAQYARISQRIACHALHDGPGKSKRCACHQCKKGTRNSKRHRRLTDCINLTAERRNYVCPTHVAGAKRNRQETEKRKAGDHDRQPHCSCAMRLAELRCVRGSLAAVGCHFVLSAACASKAT